MESPFDTTSSAPGCGRIVVSLGPLDTYVLSEFSYQYPLKLISSLPAQRPKALLVFLLTYGGGLVAGDKIQLSITLEPRTRLSLATQGSTKVFKAPSRDKVSGQCLQVHLGKGAALVLLPDPVQPFKESIYEQKQIFNVKQNASLLTLDWVSEGRTARGEKWDFWGWKGRNEIWRISESSDQRNTLVLRDNMVLDSTAVQEFDRTIAQRMDGCSVFGTLLIHGPLFENLGNYFISEYAASPRIGGKNWGENEDVVISERDAKRIVRQEYEKANGVLWVASRQRTCVVVKFSAPTAESARYWAKEMLVEEGTVEKEFGEGALICFR
ncbi:MAG: hypothetical protein M1829_006778 [Trizodia sp. TS-e1964]|nr:MAG: hypothetical protein M1829_006778 [Trizodia sp. TS-e1964]